MLTREVKIETADGTYVLSATLDALRKIAQRWPKMQDAIDDLRGLNFDACSYIVAAASGLQAEKAMQVVFSAGLGKATAACVEFLAYLINPGDEESDGTPGNP